MSASPIITPNNNQLSIGVCISDLFRRQNSDAAISSFKLALELSVMSNIKLYNHTVEKKATHTMASRNVCSRPKRHVQPSVRLGSTGEGYRDRKGMIDGWEACPTMTREACWARKSAIALKRWEAPSSRTTREACRSRTSAMDSYRDPKLNKISRGPKENPIVKELVLAHKQWPHPHPARRKHKSHTLRQDACLFDFVENLHRMPS